MKIVNYFLQYLLIKLFFLICKIIGYRKASNLGKLVGEKIGPYLKSKKIIKNNINLILPNATKDDVNLIVKKMWGNYGRILSEYVFIKDFKEGNLEKYINVIGSEYLNDIRKKNIPVVFISGHFNNFELMAMQIEKEGVNLGAIYRPLNNFFLNKTMEKIRIKHICKIQIKKGLSGIREILNLFKREAFTTTIPAQLVKKFNCPVVSIYIERIEKYNFRLIINKPIYFTKDESLEQITEKLNYILEKMVLKNPEQWILTHNRWKL